MPIITGEEPAQALGTILSLMPAAAGLRAVATAPKADVAAGVPTPTAVVGWALVADATAAGGARVDPVFLAGGTAWTPDQFRLAFGPSLAIGVASG